MGRISLYSILILTFLFGACSEKKKNGIIEASGTLEAKYVSLSAKTGGEIKRIPLSEGIELKAGDTVACIDTEGLEIQLRSANAALAIAQAQYDMLRNGARREDIATAEANQRAAAENNAQAMSDLARFKKLLEQNTVTQKQYDDALLRYKNANEQLTAAVETLKKIRNITREEELRQASGKLEQAIAASDAVRKTIRDACLITPIKGILVKKYFEQGETAAPNATVAKISDLSVMYMMIYVPEAEVTRIHTGDPADIFVDSSPGQPYKGKVTYVSPESEFSPKNIQTKDERTKLVFGVKVEIPNPSMNLKAGVPADAKVYTR